MAGNVPALVIAWEDDGIRVRLIEPLEDLPADTEVTALPAVPRKGESDIAMQKKRHGLRLGGVVVLLKAAKTEGGVTWRAIDTLREKSDVTEVRIFRRTPVSVHAPRPGTALVDSASLLLASSSVSFESIIESSGAIRLAVEEGCLYGRTGLLLRGPDKKGNILHFLLPPTADREAATVMKLLSRQKLESLLRYARSAGGAWKAIPFVEMATDPLRASRMSADVVNLPPLLPDGTAGFKLCTAAIRYSGNDWILSDATPLAATPAVYGYDAPDEVFGLASDVT